MGQEVKMQRIIQSPDKYKEVMVASGMEMRRKVVNGNKGMESGMGGSSKELTQEEIDEMKDEMDLQSILNPDKYGVSYYLQDTEDVDGKKAYVVEKLANNGKKKTVEYYDMETGLLIRTIGTMEIQGQTVTILTDILEYEEVKGSKYKVPSKLKQSMMGQEMNLKLDNVRVNRKIKDREFKL